MFHSIKNFADQSIDGERGTNARLNIITNITSNLPLTNPFVMNDKTSIFLVEDPEHKIIFVNRIKEEEPELYDEKRLPIKLENQIKVY